MEQNDNCIECNNKLNGGNILSIVTVIRALSDAKFKPFIEPRQANLCLRAFRHDKF